MSGMENWNKHETMNSEKDVDDDYDLNDVDETDSLENQDFDDAEID